MAKKKKVRRTPTHPIQPLVSVDGVVRFKENRAVSLMYEWLGADILERLKMADVSSEDMTQLAQLLGLSHSGAHDFPAMRRDVLETASEMYREEVSEVEARNIFLERRHAEMCALLRPVVGSVFKVNADELKSR